jgi:hypothetical protein
MSKDEPSPRLQVQVYGTPRWHSIAALAKACLQAEQANFEYLLHSHPELPQLGETTKRDADECPGCGAPREKL